MRLCDPSKFDVHRDPLRPTVLRRSKALLLALALVAQATVVNGQGDAPRPVPRLGLPTYRVTADDLFRWTIPIKLVNTTEGGLYTDSLYIEIEDLDPGATRRSRKYVTTDTTVTRFMPSVSARDSGVFRYSGSAFSETARIALRLFTHSNDGTRYESTGEVSVYPGMTSDHLRSGFLNSGKDSIEYVLVPEAWPRTPSPGLLIVHGWEAHARLLLPTASHLANRGYTVMVVSLPGYGLSSGPADFAGARSVAAVERALDRLRRSEGVDSTRIGAWGISQGATTVLQLAARRHDLKAVFAQSGIYDLAAVELTTTSDDLRRVLTEEAGGKKGWKRWSPMASVDRMKVPVMIFHGESDTVAPLAQANDYVTQLKAAGQTVGLRLLPARGHRINPITARDAADEFFEAHLNPVRKGRQ